MLEELNPLFYPKSLAIVGVSNDERNIGYTFLKSIRHFGFKGMLYRVNPQFTEILGHRVYSNIRDIPGSVDLALIMVPAKVVPNIVMDCLVKGVKGVEIFSSGFNETGDEEGQRLEKQIIDIAKQGIRVIGPNCFGVYCSRSRITFLAGLDFPKRPGAVAFFSQSGGRSIEFATMAGDLAIGLSKVVSYGNACDLNEADFLEYFALDNETKIIGAYIEGVKDGKRFFDIARQISKPVIVWKSGLTKNGARAVASHTGSLAGEERVWEGFFRQSGAIRVKSLYEVMDTVISLLYLPRNTGRRVAIIGGGGGLSVTAADACSQAGLEVPLLDLQSQRKIKSFLPSAGTSNKNPLDFGAPVTSPITLERLMTVAAEAPNIDTIIVIQGVSRIYSMMSRFSRSPKQAINDILDTPLKIKQQFGKPVIVILPPGQSNVKAVTWEKKRRNIRNYYLDAGIPTFPSLDRATKAVTRLIQYYERRA
jgi:acyl-CoA synthetase (NDP forming)